MSQRIIPGVKDATGAYIPSKPDPVQVEVPVPDRSIDDLFKMGLTQIQRLIMACGNEIKTAYPNSPSRECVMNLKDAMGMLQDLKKREKELLDNMSDEELAQLVAQSKDANYR